MLVSVHKKVPTRYELSSENSNNDAAYENDKKISINLYYHSRIISLITASISSALGLLK